MQLLEHHVIKNYKTELLKLLIIDDETDYCFLLQQFFARRGVDVAVCHRLNQGMKMLSETNFDVVILDNNLPDGLGWEKAVEITSNYAHTQLILISAFPQRYQTTLPPQAKMLEKPVSLSDLQRLIAAN